MGSASGVGGENQGAFQGVKGKDGSNSGYNDGQLVIQIS
jgi:hypothetical protein